MPRYLKPKFVDPDSLIDGDPARWLDCRTAVSVSLSIIIREKIRTARVIAALNRMRFGLPEPTEYSDLVAFVPADRFKRVLVGLKAAGCVGATICAAADLTRHVVVFRIKDVELGLTPAPAHYVLYDTTPGKNVRHHNIIRRFNPTGHQKRVAERVPGRRPGRPKRV